MLIDEEKNRRDDDKELENMDILTTCKYVGRKLGKDLNKGIRYMPKEDAVTLKLALEMCTIHGSTATMLLAGTGYELGKGAIFFGLGKIGLD